MKLVFIVYQFSTSVSVAVVLQYCQAGFAFIARGGQELSLAEGEVVKVIHQCDLEGNPEWWLVENSEGSKGYAPANYLYAMM